MRVVKAGYQILTPQSPTKHIERIARICYKSEDNICDGSDIKMIKSLISRQHLAMIEHASVCIEVDEALYEFLGEVVASAETFVTKDAEAKKIYLRFTECVLDKDTMEDPIYRYLVSGNLRAWYEFMEYYTHIDENMSLPFVETIIEAAGGKDGVLGKWHPANFTTNNSKRDNLFRIAVFEDSYAKLITDFSTLTDEERWVHEDVSVVFTVDRGVTHELVRMRDCSFAQESTRYCNYSNDKFGNDITVIQPCFWDKDSVEYSKWYKSCALAEKYYMALLNEFNAKPQEARSVLPQSVKAEIAVTTNLREWHHILNLRACDATGPAHPQMKEVMVPLLLDFKERYKTTDIFSNLNLK